MPALACWTIRTDLAITTTMNAITTTSRMVATRVLMAAPLLRPGRFSGEFAASGSDCYGTDRKRVRPVADNSVLPPAFAKRARAVQRDCLCSISSWMPKVLDRFFAVNTSSIGPDASTEPRRSSIAWVKPSGTSSTWWVTSTIIGALGSRASAVSRRSRSSRPPRSSPAAGSSSSSSSGSGIRARAIWTRLRSPSDRVANLRLIRWAQPSASSSSTARVTSPESYSSFHRPKMAYEAVSTRSMTFSPGGTCSAIEALVSPILGRRSKMSTSPSFSPRISTVPWEGNASVAAIWSSVVLPAPLGPMRIHRSSPCAVQSTLRSRTAESRLTSTPRSRSTSSDIRPPFFARHHGPAGSIGRRDRTYATAPCLAQPGADNPSRPPGRPPGVQHHRVCAPGPWLAFSLLADREQRGLGAVLDAELGQHRTHVRLDRLLRDAQRPCDLPVGPAVGEFGQDLALPAGERVQARSRARRTHQRPGRLRRQQQVAVVYRADRAHQRIGVDVLVDHPGGA